jgi:hypothetical protein
MISRRVLVPTAVVSVLFGRTSRAQSARHVSYDIPLIPQQTAMSCWAAAIAMIVSWARDAKVEPLEIAIESDRTFEYEAGLAPLDAELFDRWGMTTEAPQTFTADGFMDLLDEFGPIWVAAQISAPHVRVATGFRFGNPSYAGPVTMNDPLERGLKQFKPSNQGATYSESYVEFVRQNESLGSEDLRNPKLNDAKLYSVYFAHLKQKPRSRTI